MNLLTEEVERYSRDADWLTLSSSAFGTCMIHRALFTRGRRNIDDDDEDDDEDEWGDVELADDAWVQSYLHNFGEFLDRVKLYAMLQQNG